MTLIASAPIAIDYSASNGFTQVWSINDEDEVAGGTATSAAVWQNGQTTLLPGVPGGQSGLATAANAQGQVVGYSFTGTAYQAILWQNGAASDIPSLGASNRIYDISAQGVMVGSAEDGSGLAVAVEISNGTLTQLGELPGGDISVTGLAASRAFSINDQGQVVGLSLTASGVQHAVLWQNGSVTDLGAIAGGGLSIAYQINDHGVIVGYAQDANGIDQAVVWQNGAMTVLPDHQSNGHSYAYGINDSGIIVGRSDVYTVQGGWQDDAVLWQNGILVDLNSFLPTNSGWVLNTARSINDNGEIAGMGTYDGVETAFVLSIGDSAGPMVSASGALQAFQEVPHGAALSVLDSAADIQSDLSGLETVASAGKLLQVRLNDVGTPVLTVTAGQLSADGAVLSVLSGSYHLNVTQETVLDAGSALAQPHVTSVSIADQAFYVGAELDLLQSWAAAGQLNGISLTDGTDPTLTASAQSVANDSLALKAIQGSYQLDIVDATVAQALSMSAEYPVATVLITDTIDAAVDAASQLQSLSARYTLSLTGTVADLSAHFDALAALDGATFFNFTLTDTDFPTLSITAAQARAGSNLISSLQGDFILSIDASQLVGGTINGAPGAATVVVFPDPVADYGLSTWGGSFATVENIAAGGTDTLVEVTALKFADTTDFVAEAPTATGISSGNVAELYAAVLDRKPDVAGLAYYEHQIESGQGPSMLQLATNFLNSPEYTGNPAHAYAQGAAGDAQFITDTYQNLLHRAPEAGAVAYYQAVIGLFTANLTPGTAAYAAAEIQGHAQVLVNFSASAEFLGDVEITAQHPADQQHWLLLVA